MVNLMFSISTSISPFSSVTSVVISVSSSVSAVVCSQAGAFVLVTDTSVIEVSKAGGLTVTLADDGFSLSVFRAVTCLMVVGSVTIFLP